MDDENINEDVNICEVQEKRIWIHNIEIGYGCWIESSKLAEMVKETTKKNKVKKK